MEKYQFTLGFKVRDYECDLQGVVNNAVYQNYLEHTRHEFLKSIGVDFANLSQQGINLVVTRVEIDYKNSLRSGDEFIVGLTMERISPVRFGFRQEIIKTTDNKLIINALVTGTAINEKGRPHMPKEIEEKLDVNAY